MAKAFLKRRINLIWRTVFALGIILSVFLVIELLLIRKIETHRKEKEIVTLFESFSSSIENALWKFDENKLIAIAQDLSSRSGIAWVEINVASSDENYTFGSLQKAATDTECSKIYSFDFNRKHNDIDTLLGSLSACYMGESFYFSLSRELIVLVIFALGSLLVMAAVIVYIIYRALLNPISQLIEQLRSGELVTDLRLKRDSWDRGDDLEVLYQELLAAARALRTENAIAHSTFQAISDGVVILDRNRRVIRQSDSIQEIFGEGFGDFSEFPVAEIFDNSAFSELGRVKTIRTERGKYLEVITSHLPTGGYAVVIRDKTDEFNMREETMKQSRLRSIGMLSSGIAHDFNNFLSVIAANVDLLNFSSPRESDKPYIDSIQSASKSAAAVTAKLLTYTSNPEHGEEVFKAREVVEMVEALVPSATNSGRGWNTFVRSESVMKGSIRQLSSAILNLVLNAFDAIPMGGRVSLGVEDTVCNHKKSVAFIVTDNGTGIASNFLNKIKEPFTTTKPSGQGVGLGLSMVQAYAESVGGELAIESKEGEGTIVKLLLPTYGDVSAYKGKDLHVVRNMLQGINALIIEDMSEVAEAVSAQLKVANINSKYILINNENAGTKNDIWRDENYQLYDVIFCDVLLGSLAAIDVFDHVKNVCGKKIPHFIFMSGNIPAGLLDDLQSIPNSTIMMKPLSVSIISEHVYKTIVQDEEENACH